MITSINLQEEQFFLEWGVSGAVTVHGIEEMAARCPMKVTLPLHELIGRTEYCRRCGLALRDLKNWRVDDRRLMEV